MVYVGIFVLGVSFAALAALYTPKKKIPWDIENSPKVITIISLGRRKK